MRYAFAIILGIMVILVTLEAEITGNIILDKKFSIGWDKVNSGEKYNVINTEFENILLSSVNFIPVETIFNADFTVSALDTLPDHIIGFNGKTFQYFEMDTNIMSDEYIIQFKIPADWFYGIPYNEISLYRYDLGWQELMTSEIGANGGDIFYESIAENVGYFAIAWKEPITQEYVFDEYGKLIVEEENPQVTEQDKNKIQGRSWTAIFFISLIIIISLWIIIREKDF